MVINSHLRYFKRKNFDFSYRLTFFFFAVAGIRSMVDLLERYGGWPVVKGEKWNADNNWNWINISQQISNDGLLKLILSWSISVDIKNSTRNILMVSFR